MQKIYTEQELKETFPQSWAKRDKYGNVDEKKIASPLNRSEDTWSDADIEYVKEIVKANADKVMSSGKGEKFNQMLIDELASRRRSTSYGMSDTELNRLLGTDDDILS